ncbi:hypothetical protein [Natronococcus occultus]|uniref:hypothetical protein n=1 Tax=Natronococcus occultus TaxID=29288 RepID=UPI0014615AD4|nr:hypothetical protein [Natronococcus occultus]
MDRIESDNEYPEMSLAVLLSYDVEDMETVDQERGLVRVDGQTYAAGSLRESLFDRLEEFTDE